LSRQLCLTKFEKLSLADPFFESLKAAYGGFTQWFEGKAKEDVYVVEDDGRLSGMIYLKPESGPVDDVHPPLPAGQWLKVGTLKIEGRGTKLGERVLKKILDTAIAEGMDGIYITIFELHEELTRLFERYGFKRRGIKTSADGTELVLVRRLNELTGDLIADYPFVHTAGRNAWLLAVYPEYHTQLLPDSILNNEPQEIVRDVSHTNTIHKAYIGRIPLTRMSRGDAVVIYRTSDNQGPAFYRSVATSICVVEEVRRKQDFPDAQSFVEYASPHSVFSEGDLLNQFVTNDRLYIARMTYNAAFERRTTRGRLLEEAHISEQPRWDLRQLSSAQLAAILEMGKVNARLIVD
jgi:L-amino acid N-acyltransferase YncA